VNWRITLEVTGELEQEEQSLMTTLSQAYLEWERATELRGELRGIEQGRQEGIKQEARALILRQLNRRIGELPEAVRLQIDGLSVAQLESLGEALLDFSNLSDLEAWLREQA
jgi:predicted transposase YdaD